MGDVFWYLALLGLILVVLVGCCSLAPGPPPSPGGPATFPSAWSAFDDAQRRWPGSTAIYVHRVGPDAWRAEVFSQHPGNLDPYGFAPSH